MKIFFLLLGFLSLGLGAAGAVLPVLPSTPLLLLAAFCFAKSSERLNNWFKGTNLYKNNLESFAQGKGMTRQTKMRSMGTVTLIMAVAFIAMRSTMVGRVCLAVVWVCHILAFCCFIKTCPSEEDPKP